MNTVKKRILDHLAAIVFFVFSICLYGPYSLFFPNSEEFWFSLADFSTVVIPVSLIVLLVLIVISAVFPETKRHIVFKIFFGITLAMYVQGTYINISYGSGVQNGTEIVWSNYTGYAIWSSLIWVVCLAVPFIVDLVVKKNDRKFYKAISAFAALLVAIQIPAFVSQAFSYQPTENKEFFITDENLFELSEDHSIVMFILDTMDEQYYQEYADAHPDIADELTGFVHYDNVATAGAHTIIGLPALLTGTPYTKSTVYSEYLHTVWSSPNLFSVLHDEGYKVSVYGDTMEFSDDATEYVENFVRGQVSVGSYPVLAEKIYKMDMFKFMPHLLKRFFWYDSSEFAEAKSNEEEDYEIHAINDPLFYEKFRENEFMINEDGKKVLQVYHLRGAHQPYAMDENAKETASTLKQQVAGSFNQIRRIIADLKDKNLYDKTTLLIMADHGEKHKAEHPMLLLKDAGATGPYKTSHAPVSYFDVCPYLTSLVGKQLNNDYSMDLKSLREDTVRERHMFYNSTGNSKVVIEEYATTGDAGDFDSWKKVNLYEEADAHLIEYELGTVLTFKVDATGNRYAFEGFGNNTGKRTRLHGPLAVLKIPIKNLPSSGKLKVTIGFKNYKDDYNKRLTVVANGRTVYEGVTEPEYMKNGLPVSVDIDSFSSDHVLTLELHFPDVDESEMELSVKRRTQIMSMDYLVIDKE